MAIALHHLALRTADVRALADFYIDMFAMSVVRDALPRSLWLGLGGCAVLMIEVRETGEPTLVAGSMELVAFRVDDTQREQVRAKAMAAGCFDGETRFTVYLRDPDGRRVGVSSYDLAVAMS